MKLFYITVLAMSLSGCAAEYGFTSAGPAGARGAVGATGAQGLPGDVGPAGASCNPVDNDYDDSGATKVFICHCASESHCKTLKVAVTGAAAHLANHAEDASGPCAPTDASLFE